MEWLSQLKDSDISKPKDAVVYSYRCAQVRWSSPFLRPSSALNALVVTSRIQFLPAWRCDIAMARCLSVCPSVTRHYCIEMAEWTKLIFGVETTLDLSCIVLEANSETLSQTQNLTEKFEPSWLCAFMLIWWVCCLLQYLSLMAELGQGPPPTSNNDDRKTSFSPARPMLGASQPVLGLPAPTVSRTFPFQMR